VIHEVILFFKKNSPIKFGRLKTCHVQQESDKGVNSERHICWRDESSNVNSLQFAGGRSTVSYMRHRRVGRGSTRLN